jgi:hypothetical protein
MTARAELPASLVALLRCPTDGSALCLEHAPGGTLLAGAARTYPVVLGRSRCRWWAGAGRHAARRSAASGAASHSAPRGWR